MNHSSPMLLVLGAGQAAYRSYALRSVAAAAPVVLLDPAPPAWTDPLTTAQISTDLTDPEEVAKAVDRAANDFTIGGVLTYAEEHTATAAAIAEHLGLPGATPQAAAACRDKAATRRLLAKASVPSARHRLVHTHDEAVAAADTIGYPVVVKPRSLAGSVAVRRANNADQVRSAYRQAAGATILSLHTDGVLIEQYITGREVSCEGIIAADGTLHLAAVTQKALSSEPAFEETGHLVDAADKLLSSPSVHQVIADAASAVGATCCVFHMEMRVDSSDMVTGVIEIGLRLGGDLIPYLVRHATGIDLPRAAAQLALGHDLDLAATRCAAAAIRFVYPHQSGVVHERVPPADPHPDWLDRFGWMRAVGDHVQPPPSGSLLDRLAHFVVTGPDATTCHIRLNSVTDQTRVHVHPTTRQHACVQ